MQKAKENLNTYIVENIKPEFVLNESELKIINSALEPLSLSFSSSDLWVGREEFDTWRLKRAVAVLKMDEILSWMLHELYSQLKKDPPDPKVLSICQDGLLDDLKQYMEGVVKKIEIVCNNPELKKLHEADFVSKQDLVKLLESLNFNI